MNSASLPRRFACLFYEALVLTAVLFLGAIPVVALTQFLPHELSRLLVQIFWLLLAGTYFNVFWRRGQTLAMKTWRIRVETTSGAPLDSGQAVKRYVLVVLLFPVTWFWAFFDRERQFLHDRLAGTRLVSAVPSTK
jgi:uncharacterized RDD family membrane protein YckC